MPACMGLSHNEACRMLYLCDSFGESGTTTKTCPQACQVTTTLSSDVQAEGEMAPDNLYRMTVQLIKVCASSTLQRMSSSLLCCCTNWTSCLLQWMQEYSGIMLSLQSACFYIMLPNVAKAYRP